MHPRLERVAIDGPDHVDGVTHIGISGALPDRLGVARRLAVGRRGGNGQCTQCRTGSIVPAATPITNTQGNAAENRRRQDLDAASDKYLFSRMGTYSQYLG